MAKQGWASSGWDLPEQTGASGWSELNNGSGWGHTTRESGWGNTNENGWGEPEVEDHQARPHYGDGHGRHNGNPEVTKEHAGRRNNWNDASDPDLVRKATEKFQALLADRAKGPSREPGDLPDPSLRPADGRSIIAHDPNIPPHMWHKVRGSNDSDVRGAPQQPADGNHAHQQPRDPSQSDQAESSSRRPLQSEDLSSRPDYRTALATARPSQGVASGWGARRNLPAEVASPRNSRGRRDRHHHLFPKDLPSRPHIPPFEEGDTISEKSMPTIMISNSGVDDERSSAYGPDIRNEIGPEHLLQQYEGKWYKNDWGEKEILEGPYLRSDAFINPFIHGWLADVSEGSYVDLENAELSPHWVYDINPATGEFVDPPDYPNTMTGDDCSDAKTLWRRMNWTASLVVRNEISCLARERSKARRVTATPLLLQLSDFPEPKPKPFTTRVECYVRPATLGGDMAGCLAIYNKEIQEGTQALDVDLLKLADFQAILKMCKHGQLPFIVAISPEDPSSTAQNRNGHAKESVIAFGFLSVYTLGLAGSLYGTSRYSVKANIYVHPDHRRKRVGVAILDRLLRYSSPRHASYEHYDSRDPRDDRVYMPGAAPQSRPYDRVYIEVLFKGEDDPEKAWYDKTLEEFRFRQKGGVFDKSHRTADKRGDHGVERCRVTYQHDCIDERTKMNYRIPVQRPGMPASKN